MKTLSEGEGKFTVTLTWKKSTKHTEVYESEHFGVIYVPRDVITELEAGFLAPYPTSLQVTLELVR